MSDDPTVVTPPRAEREEPRVLGGRYEVGALIGRGGMADVHVGTDLRLGRTVAIKILRTDLARDSSFLARFRREAQSAAGLSHPAIVGVFDSGEETVHELAGGAPVQVPYIVMEFVDGRTLREVLNEAPGKVLEPAEAARITAAVLTAMEYAHARGLVHRDIKPANVMVTSSGAVKVMDFGIARALADTAATMTQTSAVMGTARYLSPEQAQGLDVDGRSDLYSVGCLLYELLAGRTPFQGDPVSLVYQHLGETPKPPSTYRPLPQGIEAVTLHALEKDPDERYQDAASFRADLSAVRADQPVSAAAMASLAAVTGTGAAGGPGAGSGGSAAAAGVGAAALGAGAAAAARSRRAMSPTESVPVPGPDPAPGDADGERGVAAYLDDRWERTDELPVRERRHPGAALLLGALALLAVAGVAWVLYSVIGPGSGPPEPVQVTVPSTVGQTEARAREMLTEHRLTVGDVTPRHSDREEGTVIDQNPQGGMAEENSAVDLVVSAGPEAITVPDLRGWDEDSARAELARLKFTNVAEKPKLTDSPDHEKDEVIATTPEGGTAAAPDELITLEVASGKVKMPELVGKTRDEAVLLVHDNGLVLEEVQLLQTWEQDPGTVLEQSTDPDKRVNLGTRITIVVAELPPQTATVTTEKTVTQAPPPTSEEPTSDPPTSEEPTTDPPTSEEPSDPPDPTTPTSPPVDPPGRPTPPPSEPPTETG